MSRAVLHIGTHKTATTAIQATCFELRSVLEQQGFSYPKAGWGTAHHSLAAAWVDIPEKYCIPNALESWRKAIAPLASRATTIVLSSEEFPRCSPRQVPMAELSGLFTGFDQLEVLCTVRQQSTYIPSIYLESSKRRAIPDVATFVELAMRDKVCEGLFLDYTQLYDHLLQGFNATQVHFFSYEIAALEAGGIIGSFFRFLGASLSAQRLSQMAARTENVSMEPLAVWVASCVDSTAAPDTTLVDAASAALDVCYGKSGVRSLFTRDEASAVATRFAELNKNFIGQVQAQQADFCMGTPAQPAVTLWRDEIDLAMVVAQTRDIIAGGPDA